MPADANTSRERVWETLEAELESLKAPINAEIRAYPLPIPGCDAQYNHLLEQRSAIAGELRRLRAAREADLPVERVLETSTVLDDARKEAIRRRLGS